MQICDCRGNERQIRNKIGWKLGLPCLERGSEFYKQGGKA